MSITREIEIDAKKWCVTISKSLAEVRLGPQPTATGKVVDDEADGPIAWLGRGC